ncbi:MAG: hypothetical protein V1872_02740 [bacterium]
MRSRSICLYLLLSFIILLIPKRSFSETNNGNNRTSNKQLTIDNKQNGDMFLKQLVRDPFEPYVGKKGGIPTQSLPVVTKFAPQQPFNSTVPTPLPLNEYKLSAVVYDPVRPLVIINDSILYNGDHIKGSKVIAISPGEVVLEKGGQRYTLKIEE